MDNRPENLQETPNLPPDPKQVEFTAMLLLKRERGVRVKFMHQGKELEYLVHPAARLPEGLNSDTLISFRALTRFERRQLILNYKLKSKNK